MLCYVMLVKIQVSHQTFIDYNSDNKSIKKLSEFTRRYSVTFPGGGGGFFENISLWNVEKLALVWFNQFTAKQWPQLLRKR